MWQGLIGAFLLDYADISWFLMDFAVLQERGHKDAAIVIPSACSMEFAVEESLLLKDVLSVWDLWENLIICFLDSSVSFVGFIQILMKTLILSDGRVVGPKHDSCYSKLWRVDLLHNFEVTEKDRVIVDPLSFDVCC